MSGNWDDTDTDDDVEVVDTLPVVRPRSRQPSLAKSLEKTAILDNPVEGSTADELSDSEDSISVASVVSADFGEVEEDFHVDCLTTKVKEIIRLYPSVYRDIIMEFADVELFLISVDSLILELTAHKIHDWTVGGQTLLITRQFDRFLAQFTRFGGKFKLIAFSGFDDLYKVDSVVDFVRAVVFAHIRQGPFKHDFEIFKNPSDLRWCNFLHDLTPSFFMISYDDISKDFCDKAEASFSERLASIVLSSLALWVPIVPLDNISVCFSVVNAHFIFPRTITIVNQEAFFFALWDAPETNIKLEYTEKFNSVAECWAAILANARKHPDVKDSALFEPFSAALLLSALICEKRGLERRYLEIPEKKKNIDFIRLRRVILFEAANLLLNGEDCFASTMVADFYDGRMVLSLFDAIVDGQAVLPYRLQESFASVHQKAGLLDAIPTDTTDALFDQAEELQPATQYECFTTESKFIKHLVPESEKFFVTNYPANEKNYELEFKKNRSWRFKNIEETFSNVQEKIEDKWQKKKANRGRQFLSRWYELFANSLEGRGSNLLVDFSRAPRGFAVIEEDSDKNKKEKGGWSGQKGQKPSQNTKKKTGEKSRKEQILEANKNAKANKLVMDEIQKIRFAVQQKQAIFYLKNLMSTLQNSVSRAQCAYEITIRLARDLSQTFNDIGNLEKHRKAAVPVIGMLKSCFNVYWADLNEKQQEDIVNIWVSFGFDAPANSKPSSEAKQKKMDLKINMVYYQLQYAGELIEIQSDPQKDDRVTGFSPDGWQRRMLDVVDRNQSALIVAPTSAGKTFVSYYCIERTLRSSDEDVVVYISPSKALTNQVCGSVYARFRNKLMTRGKALFGTLTADYDTNAINCQVLVTVPECLESLLLSTSPAVQQFVSKIQYVIFDEVHSIGSSSEAVIWEHLLLLIRCPFLALSATIGNAEVLHEWLVNVEASKSTTKPRKVNLIQYGERYSELELAIQNVKFPTNESESEETNIDAPAVENNARGELMNFMPYGVFMPEKIRMFGIPSDQQLTARQIFDLFTKINCVDPSTGAKFEPCTFFGQTPGKLVWLSRSMLRDLENNLKQTIMTWLENSEHKELLDSTLGKLREPVETQLDVRSRPFDDIKVAQENIIPLVNELREQDMLPAICFNEDRFVCENLAERVCIELEKRQAIFESSAEYKRFEIKDEDKLIKQQKRKRDATEKKKKGDKPEDTIPDETEEADPFAAQRAKLNLALAKFTLRQTKTDDDLYEKMVDRMSRIGKTRESTKLLLRLFERGIGYHHSGLGVIERGAVEILFRSGHLTLLFSTSTLALGMNMPCRTVIFGVDNIFLTPLLYRQMSGRAGRRGFDHSGTVVFSAIPTGKIRRLLTASLSSLIGNPPFSVTFVLKLLSFVHQPDIPNPLDKNSRPISTINERAKIAKCLLQTPFSIFTRSEGKNGKLQNQLRAYIAYSYHFLRKMQLIDDECNATGFAQFMCNLQIGEPANFAFLELLRTDVFHKLCKKYTGEVLNMKLLEILANLFVKVRVPYFYNPEDPSSYPSESGCRIFLPDFKPEDYAQSDAFCEEYTRFMEKFFNVSTIKSPEMKLSRNCASVREFGNELLVPATFDEYSHDPSFFPFLHLSHGNHRNRKIYYNAYILDFWTTESRKVLERVNKIHHNNMWSLLNKFKHILFKISNGLQVVARPQDPVALAFQNLATEFDKKFSTAFLMKIRH